MEVLWDEYLVYVRDVQPQEWKKYQYVGKDGDRKEDAQKIPPSVDGFKRWCRKVKGFYVHQYFDNKDNYYTDFVEVCAYIREEVKEDHIIGGMLNMYNPSITQRLHGLADNLKLDGPKKVSVTFRNKQKPEE